MIAIVEPPSLLAPKATWLAFAAKLEELLADEPGNPFLVRQLALARAIAEAGEH